MKFKSGEFQKYWTSRTFSKLRKSPLPTSSFFSVSAQNFQDSVLISGCHISQSVRSFETCLISKFKFGKSSFQWDWFREHWVSRTLPKYPWNILSQSSLLPKIHPIWVWLSKSLIKHFDGRSKLINTKYTYNQVK